MKIEKDGDIYCVHSDKFTNLQDSDEYFFITKKEYLKFKDDMKAIYYPF